jgi:50S ribosomal subunit-associated GTPase HflX
MLCTHADHSDAAPANFIIFGEMGAGKSSLVNLIAGKPVAVSSSGAMSCTLDSTVYTIRLPDYQREVNLYDTVSKQWSSHTGVPS